LDAPQARAKVYTLAKSEKTVYHPKKQTELYMGYAYFACVKTSTPVRMKETLLSFCDVILQPGVCVLFEQVCGL
jgi:hypothetical protein